MKYNHFLSNITLNPNVPVDMGKPAHRSDRDKGSCGQNSCDYRKK